MHVHTNIWCLLFVAVISQLMQQLGVYISVRRKVKESCVSVIVKSIEQNSHCVYQTRDYLLHGKQSPVRFDGSVSLRDPLNDDESFTSGGYYSQGQRRRSSLTASETTNDVGIKSRGRRSSESFLGLGQSQQTQHYTTPQVTPTINPFAAGDYSVKKEKATKCMGIALCNIPYL